MNLDFDMDYIRQRCATHGTRELLDNALAGIPPM